MALHRDWWFAALIYSALLILCLLALCGCHTVESGPRVRDIDTADGGEASINMVFHAGGASLNFVLKDGARLTFGPADAKVWDHVEGATITAPDGATVEVIEALPPPE